MILDINGKTIQTEKKLEELKKEYSADITIINGFQTEENKCLAYGDSLVFIKKGLMPDKEQFEAMLSARHTPGLYRLFKKAAVGIAGLGGLGSNIAVMLAQSGVGKLVIADYDTVEPSNLNRQHYSIKHLGMNKTEAVKKQISDINPYAKVLLHNVRINEKNAAKIFSECSIVCEAFDDPKGKAALVSSLMSEMPHIKIVSASGMAGIESGNSITTKRRFKNLYICGDGATEAGFGKGLMAPRAMICAGHQANMVLRLISGEEAP